MKESNKTGIITCKACSGTGLVKLWHGIFPGSFRESTCEGCGGTGILVYDHANLTLSKVKS